LALGSHLLADWDYSMFLAHIFKRCFLLVILAYLALSLEVRTVVDAILDVSHLRNVVLDGLVNH
jgi:hypothetical protein